MKASRVETVQLNESTANVIILVLKFYFKRDNSKKR